MFRAGLLREPRRLLPTRLLPGAPFREPIGDSELRNSNAQLKELLARMNRKRRDVCSSGSEPCLSKCAYAVNQIGVFRGGRNHIRIPRRIHN